MKEEQKFIEAKIRMRQQELLDEELRMLRKQEMSSSNTETTLTDAALRNITGCLVTNTAFSLLFFFLLVIYG